jgi:CheY-like chemotaxis protein
MPDMDGLETICRIKSVEQFFAIPIIMVTGNSERGVIASSLKSGADDFLLKPFNCEILLEKISEFVN